MFKINNYLRRLPPKKRKLAVGAFEFLKLQLAGNIPFWGTLWISLFLDKYVGLPKFESLLIGTVLSYTAFFFISDRWVFNLSRSKRRAITNAWRFVVFMSATAVLTFFITWTLYDKLGISIYIGQFISAAISITWTFAGMKFWVFAPTRKRAAKQATRRSKKTTG